MKKLSLEDNSLKSSYSAFRSVFGTQIVSTKGRITYKLQKAKKKATHCAFCDKSGLIKNNEYIGEVRFNPDNDKFEWNESADDNNDYLVLVVKNIFPIIDRSLKEVHSLNLVIIEAREHLTHFHLLSHNNIKACILAYRSLMKKFGDKFLCYNLYKNQGKSAQSSMEHIHSQFVFLDQIPNRYINNANELFKKGECVLCKRYHELMTEADQFILREYRYFLEYCPKYIYPYTIRILPKRHIPDLLALSKEEILELSKILKIATNRIIGNFGELDYNILYHQSPKIYRDRWHLFIEIIPRGLNEPAGFEMLTGIRVTEDPENAAHQLREIKSRCVMCGEYYVDELGFCPYCGYLKLHLIEEDF
ncbi:MAG: hypothetical protein ACTSRG_17545 [Candidatus Helarchaeota archaeon]